MFSLGALCGNYGCRCQVTKRVGTMLKEKMVPASEGSRLTSLEIEYLTLIAAGKSTKEIAHTFDMSVNAALTFRRGICRKLGIHNAANLLQHAVWNGLLLAPAVSAE